ncbi:MAG: accessory gene regulator B family protein [Ruminococcus flavefaciens]|nr:accessory gene regulator B family protein [Ruminococcus flavefaciens]
MFDNIAVHIVDKLIEYNTINSDDRDIYKFGINQIFTTLLNFTTIILIGLVIDSVKEAVFFFTAFIPLRIFAGGFHSRTPLRCYIYSSIITVAVLLAMRYINIPLLIYCLIYIVSSVIILFFAPVEDINKPLDDLEKKVYKNRTVKIWIVESIAFIIFELLKMYTLMKCFLFSIILSAILIVLGFINNMILTKKE